MSTIASWLVQVKSRGSLKIPYLFLHRLSCKDSLQKAVAKGHVPSPSNQMNHGVLITLFVTHLTDGVNHFC